MKTALLMVLSLYCLKISAFNHDHVHWDEILKKNTQLKSSQVLVDYKALKKNPNQLNQYLDELKKVKPSQFASFSEKQKLAFWINAYNAFTIDIVLKHYPIESIKEIKSGWFSSGPWKIEFIPLLGKTISLDEIEHNIIRKRFDEPRIHFALNCASLGCPSLYQQAFNAKHLDTQLQSAALHFLTNKKKNYLKGDTLYLSKIFKWYGDDFQKKYKSYKNFIIKTLQLKKEQNQNKEENYKIEFNEYDWKLNGL